MLLFLSPIISAITSFIIWLLGYYFVTRKDRNNSEKQFKEMREHQKMTDDELKKRFLLSQGREPLMISYRLKEGIQQKLVIYDKKGSPIVEAQGSSFIVRKKQGWISKVILIQSTFKSETAPIVDSSTQLEFKSEMFYDFNDSNYSKQEHPLLEVIQSGNEIEIKTKKVMNYYSDIDEGIFYQFYLLMGTGQVNELLMFGSDKVGNDYLPFLLGKDRMLSTVNTINDDFRREYYSLKDYLNKNGISC